MIKIAHMINPVNVPASSDLYKAQPITFQALQAAREFARNQVDVSLLSAQYPEDHSVIPDNWQTTPDLTRSVLDFGQFTKSRKLPILKDILDRLYKTADAEYLIYTNIDIAPLPHFYVSINAIIEAGFDAFVINRRTISDQYELENLPMMYADIGEPHPGHDCFIFRRDMYPHFELGHVCLGARFVGRVLIWNLVCFSNTFKEFTDLHLTFHLGNDKIWKSSRLQDYAEFNKKEALKIFDVLKTQNGGFPQNHLIQNYLSGFAPSRYATRIRARLRQYWRSLLPIK